MARALLVAIVVIVTGFVGYRMLRSGPDARSRDREGHCLLRARVYTFGEGEAQPRRVFGVQNLDDDDWVDLTMTISGIVTGGPQANQPTGDYTQSLPTYDAKVAPKKSREVPLEDFRSGSGPRWIPMTMRVTKAHLQARIGAETCTFDTPVPQASTAQ